MRVRAEWAEFAWYAVLAWLLWFGLPRVQSRHPAAYAVFVREDGHLESGGAIAFLLGAALMAVLAMRRGPLARRVLWAAIALAMFTIGMEEISWGQRILGFSTPEVLRDSNFQGEPTLHNLSAFSAVDFGDVGAAGALLWLALSLVPTIARLGRISSLMARYGLLAPWQLTPLFLMSGFYAFEPAGLYRQAEIGESLLGLLALLYAWTVWRSVRSRVPETALFRIVSSAAILALVAASSLAVASHRRAYGDLARMAGSLSDASPAQALAIYQYLDGEGVRWSEVELPHATLLLELAREEEAHQILDRLIAMLLTRGPDDDDPATTLRELGTAYTLRGEGAAAARAFADALAHDRRLLVAVRDTDERATLLWSLARTLSQRGDRAEALAVAHEALQAATAARLTYQIRRWIAAQRF